VRRKLDLKRHRGHCGGSRAPTRPTRRALAKPPRRPGRLRFRLVIDEFVLEFTHDSEVPFMLPGVAPTGRRVHIPTVVVMRFDGDKVSYEHIYWDQASVLVQVGLLGRSTLPVAGVEEADRLLELADGEPPAVR
jgi:hypothetical protein